MTGRRIAARLCLALLVCAAGCVTETQPPQGPGWEVKIASEPQDGAPGAAAPTLTPVGGGTSEAPRLAVRGPRTTGTADDGEYRIGPEDVVDVTVVGEPELQALPLRVSTRGFIDLPYAGSLQAAGLSVDELRRVLEVKLDEVFVRPQVVVSLREYKSRMVHVFGEVNRPGPFKLTHQNTLMEIVSRAGGFTPLANRSDVEIIRQNGAERRVIEVDVDEMMDEGRMDLDPMLEPGDVIRVPERLF